MTRHSTLGLLVLIFSSALAANTATTPLARAEALQPPVWLERGGVKSALAAGTILQAGDQFSTGPGARLHLVMQDDSIVKLGENAQLLMPRLELKPLDEDRNGLLSSALSVLKGAFRYTTRELGKLRRREVDVAIGPTVTAGIRGTDIWGQSDGEKELICLIEGRIEVGSPGHEAQVMDQPGSFYVVPHDQAPLPVAPAPQEKLAQWVPQTELLPDQSVLTASGGYMVGLESHPDTESAQAAVQKFSALGYATEIIRASVRGKARYRVVITGLDTLEQARAYAQSLQQRLKLHSPWVMSPPRL